MHVTRQALPAFDPDEDAGTLWNDVPIDQTGSNPARLGYSKLDHDHQHIEKSGACRSIHLLPLHTKATSADA